MPAEIAKSLIPLLKGGWGENVGGHIYDRQRCSGKLEGHTIAVIIFLGMVGS